MRLLVYATSNSSRSINRQLVRHAAAVLQAEILPTVEPELINIHDYEMPIYSFDREAADGIPQRAQDFRDLIDRADALLVSFSENNSNLSAAYKNLFDWASRLPGKVYSGKPLVALSTSPGGRGGASVMDIVSRTAAHQGAELRATFSLPRFYDTFDSETQRLKEAEHQAALRKALATLA